MEAPSSSSRTQRQGGSRRRGRRGPKRDKSRVQKKTRARQPQAEPAPADDATPKRKYVFYTYTIYKSSR